MLALALRYRTGIRRDTEAASTRIEELLEKLQLTRAHRKLITVQLAADACETLARPDRPRERPTSVNESFLSTRVELARL